jgi:uncharacterized protein with PIN domain
MKFITDGMLGKLTRWLRMLGCDVEYSQSLDDRQLIETAKAEGRVLLTRDQELYQQAVKHGIEAFLVEGKIEAENLADLSKQFNLKLEIDVTVSRCPKCNTKIRPVSKEMVVGRVPKGTLARYEDFWECPNCGQIYWQGAHWKRISRTLKEAERKMES